MTATHTKTQNFLPHVERLALGDRISRLSGIVEVVMSTERLEVVSAHRLGDNMDG